MTFILVSVIITAAVLVPKTRTETVPSWQWIKVQNINGISNGNVDFKFGDTCGIEPGNTVTLIAESGDQVLVRYSTSVDTYGTPCPNGTIFFLKKSDFFVMTDKYNEMKMEDKIARERVSKLLKDNEQ